jgi:hypothetical protein
MICPSCAQPLPSLTIRGTQYRAVKKTRIPKRYIWVDDDEILYCLPVPLLVVQPIKGAALKSKSLTLLSRLVP